MNTSDFCIVVRAAGERTADVCCEKLRQQAPDAAFFRVEQVPFWRTLRAGLQRGIDSGARWVLSVDADVLPADDMVARAMRWADGAADDVGVITGMVLDKLFAGPRYMAVRVYRAEGLPLMLDLMPSAESGEVRPESVTILKLAARGWRHEQVAEVVGLHDYEQFYRDVYRKAFLQAHKHLYLADRMLALWRKLAATDADYAVALGGFADGILSAEAAACTVEHPGYDVAGALQRLQLQEKLMELADVGAVYDEVSRVLAAIDAGDIVPVIEQDFDDFAGECELGKIEARRRKKEAKIKWLFSELVGVIGGDDGLMRLAAARVRLCMDETLVLRAFALKQLVRHVALRVRERFFGRLGVWE